MLLSNWHLVAWKKSYNVCFQTSWYFIVLQVRRLELRLFVQRQWQRQMKNSDFWLLKMLIIARVPFDKSIVPCSTVTTQKIPRSTRVTWKLCSSRTGQVHQHSCCDCLGWSYCMWKSMDQCGPTASCSSAVYGILSKHSNHRKNCLQLMEDQRTDRMSVSVGHIKWYRVSVVGSPFRTVVQALDFSQPKKSKAIRASTDSTCWHSSFMIGFPNAMNKL